MNILQLTSSDKFNEEVSNYYVYDMLFLLLWVIIYDLSASTYFIYGSYSRHTKLNTTQFNLFVPILNLRKKGHSKIVRL